MEKAYKDVARLQSIFDSNLLTKNEGPPKEKTNHDTFEVSILLNSVFRPVSEDYKEKLRDADIG